MAQWSVSGSKKKRPNGQKFKKGGDNLVFVSLRFSYSTIRQQYYLMIETFMYVCKTRTFLVPVSISQQAVVTGTCLKFACDSGQGDQFYSVRVTSFIPPG